MVRIIANFVLAASFSTRPFNKGRTSCFGGYLYTQKRRRFGLIPLEPSIISNAAMSFLRLTRILSAALLLRVGLGQSWQFNGTIEVDSDTSNIIKITVTNEGSHNYSILAKNNMFDNAHPFAPFSVSTPAGTAVPLAGSRYEYATLNDAQFMSFPSATTWTRQFNVSEYLLPDPNLTVTASQCFVITLPPSVPAILVDNILPSQRLADIFFSGGIIDVPIGSIPLHHNVSDPAGASSSIPGGNASGTQGSGGQTGGYSAAASAAARNTTVPPQPSGVTSALVKATAVNVLNSVRIAGS